MEKNRIRLDDLAKKPPFSVPEGYFDELPQIIQSKIVSAPVTRKPIWSWQRAVALASAMSVILLLVWTTLPELQGTLGAEPLAGVSEDAILVYLEDQNISYYDLSEHNVIQKAFETESTVLNYLDEVDDNLIRQQILESNYGSELI